MPDVADLDASPGSASPDSGPTGRVSKSFIARYVLAYIGVIMLFLAPLLVSLSLKVNDLVGIDRAPTDLSIVAGTGALLAMFANPFFGRMSDRTTSRFGRRRPWMVIGLVGGTLGIVVVAVAPNITVVVVGWCLAQLFFNALLAALVAVMPDQVPVAQRGQIAGILGVCLPIASVSGTYVVQLFTGNELAMFLVPCAIGGSLILVFVATMDDRQLDQGTHPTWSVSELRSAFYVSPRANPDFAWAFGSRFMFVLAYAFLTTYQAYYLLEHLGSDTKEVPRQIFVATLVMSAVIVPASLLGGWLSDRTGRRRIFVCAASFVFGVAMLVVAFSATFNGFLLAMAIGGLGFGLYVAVDLALVVDVLPDHANAGKDLGVMNIAGALPSSIAPAIAPVILAMGGGSYGLLYVVAGACAVLGAGAILRVRHVR